MFDTKAEIGLSLPSADGPKKIVVRYPTDSEFIDWRRKKKITQRDLGRRSFTIEASRPEQCDLDLLKKIRTDEDGPAIDNAEASWILSRLSECDVTERPEREGAAYAIKIKVMGKLQTSHTLRIPSVKEMMEYERSRSSITFQAYGQQEIKINFRASGDLYDKLIVSTEGYSGAIPVPHKAEAVNVLLQEIRADQEEPEEDTEGE